jgi:Cu-Zn family superoxide dismutase
MKYFIIISVSLMMIILLFFYIRHQQHLRHQRHHQCRKAIAVFTGPDVHGTVLFSEEQGRNIKIDIQVKGLRPNSLHGFHVHEAGDLSDGCTSACKHFNPYYTLHGCPGMIERHVGDLGNLKTDENGIASYSMIDDVIQLRGTNDIIGRCLVIHEDRDDCGRGGNEESTKTGNAGKRIACAVIGYSKLNFEP